MFSYTILEINDKTAIVSFDDGAKEAVVKASNKELRTKYKLSKTAHIVQLPNMPVDDKDTLLAAVKAAGDAFYDGHVRGTTNKKALADIESIIGKKFGDTK